MKRRIHITIATFLAVLAIVAIVVPTASAVRVKPGGTGPTKAERCATLQVAHDIAMSEAHLAIMKGDKAGYSLWIRTAGAYLSAAQRLGCDWSMPLRSADAQAASGPKLDPPALDVR